MPIPTTDQMTLPVLQYIADGEEYRRSDIINMITGHFSLTESERRKLGKSGQMEKSLSRREFIERSRKGHYRITLRGLEVLNQDSDGNFEIEVDDQPPEGAIEKNYQKIRERLAAELLQQIKDNTPAFSRNLLLTSSSRWDMVVHAKMPKL